MPAYSFVQYVSKRSPRIPRNVTRVSPVIMPLGHISLVSLFLS